MIATFYSFKGGVGRSLSLVETAVQLAALGRSVAVWDLDLEAPGMQKIPDLRLLENDLEIGTLNLLAEFVESGYIFPEESLAKALLPFELPKPLDAEGGHLSFLLPGRLDRKYPEQFARINWAELFQPEGGAGPAFFYKVAHSLTHQLGFEVLLIDSRTGYTDLSAVCTIQIPDLVILVTNLNEQNLAGIEQVYAAVTQTPARISGKLPAFVLANMVPEEPFDLRQEKLARLYAKGLGPHCVVPLRPELLLTDRVPSLSGFTGAVKDFAPVTREVETRRQDLEARVREAISAELNRARAKGGPEDLEDLRRRGIYEKAKTFEEKVAELFSLLGYRTTVDYKRDDMQFDVRLELTVGALPIHALVECKDTDRPVTQQQIREFASKVEYAIQVDKRPYQAIFIARSGFANNAHAVAETLRVHLQTYEQLLRSLVDLRPNLDAAVIAFQGTALERLYVEQDMVFEGDIQPGRPVEPRPLSQAVQGWLGAPSGTFLALLGDFGCGKTSFSKRLACGLALKAREELNQGGSTRIPILIDLREGGSTTVTLESLLTHHFQRLSSQPFNPQALLHLNREGHLLLIFDGFDETIAYTEPGRYVENLRQILRAAEGKAKVLLTCRTHYFRDLPEALRRLGKAPEVVSTQGATRLYEEIQDRPGSEIGYLLEFNEAQIDEYLRKALPPPADWRAFREQIRRTYNLNDLAERPFLLEIIVKTLPRLLERGSVVTLADLYETYCESWFAHTDFRLTLTRDHKVELVEYLARLVWDSPENHVHYDLLFEKATEFFKDRSLTLHDKERIDYEVRTALFLHRDPAGYYSFIHRSFLEFFLARTLRAGLAVDDSRCLSLRRLTREVVFFLEFWPEAKRIPELAGRVLEASYKRGISENALLLLYFHARATFGPLVGPGAEIEPDLAQVRKIFEKMRPKVLNLPGADFEGAQIPGIDLREAMLERANLSRADLRQAILDGARLNSAVLAFADLRQGSVEGVDLSKADLNHIDAQDATFVNTNLAEADLNFARFTRTDLSKAELKGAQVVAAGFLRASLPHEDTWTKAVQSQIDHLDLRLPTGHASAIQSISWHPNGCVLAAAFWDHALKLWDAASGRLLNTLLGHESSVLSVAWSADGQRLASASYDETILIWEPESGKLLGKFQGHTDSVISVSWAPKGHQLASGSADKTVRLWDPKSGQLLHTFKGHKGAVLSVAWSPDGRRLASASVDTTVRIWDPESGALCDILSAHQGRVHSVAWALDGRSLASASDDNTIRVWEPESGRIDTLQGHEAPVHALAWSPDGLRLASASADTTVCLWDSNSKKLLTTLRGHEARVNSVSWTPNGRRLASASEDKTIRFWNPDSGKHTDTIQGETCGVNFAAWAPDGRRLASASPDQNLRLWDLNSESFLDTSMKQEDGSFCVAWSPNGGYLASTSGKSIQIWASDSRRPIKVLQGHTSFVGSVAWAPDGRHIASASDDTTIRLWDFESGRPRNTLLGHQGRAYSVTWEPNGRRLASSSLDRTIRLWEPFSGKLLATLQGHKAPIHSVTWAPDGQRLASASMDSTVRIWDSNSGELLKILKGHQNSAYSVAWEPTGERLASASSDRTVRLWDPNSGRLLNTLEGHPRLIYSVAWDPTGRKLVASLPSIGSMVIWDVEANPPRILGHLYHTPGGSGFAMTPDGYVSGPPEALEYVRFGDGWALYDLTDVPERLSPERVAAALNPKRPRKTRRK